MRLTRYKNLMLMLYKTSVLVVVEVKGREGSESSPWKMEQLSNTRDSMPEEIKGRE